MNLKFSDEPVAYISVAKAIIAAAVAFGLSWTGEQVGAIVVLMEVIAGLFIRSQVTPTGRLPSE